jgi:hypothetical protein
VEVLLLGAGKRLGEALEEELVLAETHGGDVGEAIVFVDEVGVGVWGVEAAGEDVEQGDGVAGGEPLRNDRQEQATAEAKYGDLSAALLTMRP